MSKEKSKELEFSTLLPWLVTCFLFCIAGCDSTQKSGTQHSATDGRTPSITEAEAPPSIASLRQLLSRDTDDAEIRLALAKLYLQAGDGAAAESHFRRVIKDTTEHTTQNADHLMGLAQSLLLQRKHRQAIQIIDAQLTALNGVEPYGVEPSIEQSSNANTAKWWVARGEAQLMFKNRESSEIQRSFLQGYQSALSSNDQELLIYLKQLASSEPLVAAAQAHLECKNQEPELIKYEQLTNQQPPMRVLQVGPGRKLKRPSQAAKVAQDGDLIEIDAATYRGDAAIWTQNDIVLRGVGGIATLNMKGRHIANATAIWVFEGDNITAENISFLHAKVPNRNGAGIRLHGNSATIRNCHFENNENGILGGNDYDSDVLVEFSSFINNGYGDGQSHNIYIGQSRSFRMQYSYSQGAKVGHLVKSRAFENAILFNRLIDGERGTSSYVIDLPEGGRAWIVGNEMQQGVLAKNPMMISFAEERADREDQLLIVANNSMYNQVLNGTYVRNSANIDAQVVNNVMIGAPGIALRGGGNDINNLRRPGRWFIDAANYDYRLSTDAPAIDAGIDPEDIEGLKYLPTAEYRHPASGQVRKAVGTLDIGAREFCSP